MSKTQVKAIEDVIKMTPKLSLETLNFIRDLMEKELNDKLLKLEPSIILNNLDITEKVMYLDYLTESKSTKEKEIKESVSFEEVLKREGLTIDDLQNKN